MMIIPLKDRGLLAIKGKDASDFLQGVITQDVNKLSETPLLYSAHLTPQGRILFDFFIFKHEDMIVLDCAKSKLMPLAQKLHNYVIDKDVEFHDLTDDFHIYAFIGETAEDTCKESLHDKKHLFPDPRMTEMGWRLYSQQEVESTHTEEDYLRHRIAHGVVDLSVDGALSKNIAGEVNLDHLNAISYNKGCYVGQEMTARTHFRTNVKKRIFVVDFKDEKPLKESIIYKGKLEAGTLYSHKDGQGLAVIRHRYLKEKLILNGSEISINLPSWFKE